MRAALPLLAVSLASLVALARGDAVEDEWRVRRWATYPERHADELDRALGDEAWRERELALDACARAGPPLPAALVARVRARLRDEHPSVRAAALRALVAAGAERPLEVDRVEAFASDVLPACRLALVEAAARGLATRETLARLARDADPHVRAAAEEAFWATGDAMAFADPGRLGERGESGELLWRAAHLAPTRTRRPPTEMLRALFGDASTAAALVEAWDSLSHVGRYLDASAGERILALWRDEAQAGSERGALFAIALDALGPEGVLARLDPAELSEDARVRALDEAGSSVDWEPARGRAWWRGSERVRAAALGAFERAWDRGDRAGAGVLLTEILETGTPPERVRAFEALCRSEHGDPPADALFAYWKALDDAQRLERLRDLPRGKPLAPFRDALLELGERGGSGRSAVIDLLEAFAGDEAVAAALERWLVAELGACEHDGEGRSRPAELRAAGLVRALARVRGDDAVSAARRALDVGVRASVHVGEVAAAVLGATARGRAELLDFLGPEVPRRVRIEAAIALAPSDDPRVVNVLIGELPDVAWDLGARMVAALGSARERRAFEWLRARTLDASASTRLRGAALDALGRRPASDELLDALAVAATDAPDVDTRLAALRLLGRAREAGAVRLRALFERFSSEGWPDVEGVSQLRVQLLHSLAVTGGFPEAWLGEVLADPRRAADEWLQWRFSGREGARVEFRWSGELGTATALARQGRADAMLAHSGEWWCLDGRLLLALGARIGQVDVEPTGGGNGAGERGDALAVADSLLRAARVALAGEQRLDRDIDLVALVQRLSVVRARNDWPTVAVLADELVDLWRRRRVTDRAWHVQLGEIDRRRGVDPPGRLAALAWQARAFAALERGDDAAAREHARRATQHVGFSRAASDLQAQLAARLP